MTKINKLEMKGFKSFGNKTELIFSGGYNVILGPNGSGKSNVSDALCFVLGKGSAKGLRAEKSANLIYNGGKTRQPASYGEVSVFFDNTKNTFPIKSQEIKITRQVKKSGTSVYLLNEQKTTRQAILELLNSSHINPDGYNIILQGDIIKFVEMSTLERREIIEEIAGLGVYEEKKQKAIRELEKVDEKLKEAEIILTERKTYLKELKHERDHAMKYKDLKDKIDRNKATYLDLMIKQKQKIRDELDGKIGGYKEEIDNEFKEIEGIREEIKKRKENIAAIDKDVEQKGEKEQVRLHKEIEKLRIDIATNKNRIDSCNNEIDRIAARKEQLIKSLKEIDEKIKELTTQNKGASDKKIKLSKDIADVEHKITQFKKKNEMEEVSSIDKELESLDKDIEENQKIIEELRKDQQDLLREKDRKEFQINTLDEKIKKVTGVSEEHKEEVERLQQKRKELKNLSMEISQLLQKGTNAASQIQNANKQLERYRNELQQLQSKNISIHQLLGADAAVASIAKNKAKFDTVYGIVSELGEVDKKYSLALEVAAGPKLKSIVVSTDKTAAQCINYLKQNRLGVATFLPLNKIKPIRSMHGIGSALKSNGVHGLATDLIRYDDKFKNIFSYILGDTLVVEDIETARRIGIGSYRMVTLAGDIAELSGAMRGGYRKTERSLKFQENKVSEQLSAAEKRVGDAEAYLSRLQAERDDAMQRLERLRELKANLEGEVIVKEKSLFLESGDLDVTKQAKKDMLEEFQNINKKTDEIQTKISKENKNLAQLKINKQNLRSKISELRNPTLLAELNAFQQKKDELKEEMIKLDSDIKNIEVQNETIFAPEKENINKIMKQHDKENDSFYKEISDLKAAISLQEKELKDKEIKQKEFYDKFQDLFKQRERLHKEIQSHEEKTIRKEESIRGREHKMNAFSIENAKIKAELAGLEHEFSQYKNVEVYASKSESQLKSEINEFERMFQNFGNVNMKALEVYEAVEKEYNMLMEKSETLGKEKNHVLEMMNEIETKKKELFMRTFDIINKHFKEMFNSLSTKGDAYLELENTNNPLLEGVGIKVRIIGKKFLDIRSLSGGEKTMTALAFIFSIQEYHPASFYILDEVDAALDKNNSERLAELIKRYSKNAQYIVISHNDAVIEHGDILYGVSMGAHNMSKVVSLQT